MLGDVLSSADLGRVPGCAAGFRSAADTPEFFFHGRDTSGGVPISAETSWEAASLSKPVVALLVLTMAADRPKLLTNALRTSAADFGAEADPRWAELTLNHLLTHTSGLPNWRTQGEALAFESTPGTSGYSGEAFELALRELVQVAGVPAEQLLHDHLVALTMLTSSFTLEAGHNQLVAIGHTSDGWALPKTMPGEAMASGSLHTTLADYLRFASVIANPQLESEPALRAAARRCARPITEPAPGHGHTAGWAFTTSASGDVLWQHGDNPGFKHLAAVRPTTGEALVVFTNSDNGNQLYRAVCAEIFGVDVW